MCTDHSRIGITRYTHYSGKRHDRIKDIAIGGGVSANSLLRSRIEACGREYGWRTFLPPFSYTTDNAAMVGMAGYFKWLQKDFCPLDTVPYTRQGR